MVITIAPLITADDVPDPDSVGEGETVPKEGVTLISLFDYLCRSFMMDVPGYMQDTFASHVFRVTLSSLAGLPASASTRSKKSKQYRDAFSANVSKRAVVRREALPAMFTDTLGSITDNLAAEMRTLGSLLLHITAGPVVQTLIDALHASDSARCFSLCQKIAPPGEGEGAAQQCSLFKEMMMGRIGSHMVEKVVSVASEQLFLSIYTHYFRGQLKRLAAHPVANFVVSKLFEACPNPELASLMIDELIDEVENCFVDNHSAVVVRMAGACAAHSIRQKEVMKAVMDAFHITTPAHHANSARLIMSMTTADKESTAAEVIAAASGGAAGGAAAAEADGGGGGGGNKDAPMQFHPHGGKLLESLSGFQAILFKPIMNSIIAIDGTRLKEMACNNIGSRVLEAISRADVGLKRKASLLKKLKGQYAAMALDKFGSHVVDRFWAIAELKNKTWIAEELLKDESAIKATFHGKHVLKNCRIDFFKRKQSDWAGKITSNEKKREMFDEFFDEDDTTTPAQLAAKKVKKDEEAAKAAIIRQEPGKVEPELEALGFGGGGGGKGGGGKGGAGPAIDTNQKLDPHMATRGKDEIDDLFKTSGGAEDAHKKTKKAKKEKKEKGKDDAGGKKRKRNAHGLDAVFSAVEATKKSKKKDKKKESDGDDDGETKAATKKKKKKKDKVFTA